MRSFAWLAVPVLLAAALAGCSHERDGEPPQTTGPPTYAWVDPIPEGESHNHSDVAHHELSLNMTMLGHHALTEQFGETAHSHSIDRCQDWVVLGRSQVGEYGVDIVDVSDPANPDWVGQYRDPNAVPADRDVAWSGDCEFIFMANQGITQDTSGMRVINAKDKAKPVFESFYHSPGLIVPGTPASVSGSYHTVYALKVGSDQFVYGLNYGVHILKLQANPVTGKQELVLQGRYITADAEQLQKVNEGSPDTTATRRAIYGHDMSVYVEGGRTIMYVAYAYDGLRIVDITNPSAPQPLGHWVPETPGAPHYVHSVKTYMRPDGQRITVLGAETFEPRNEKIPSPLWVLDTSNPADIRHLASWWNPGNHGSDILRLSLHFYEVENDQIWLTHYHGGVWVLDISDPTEVVLKGYYMPHEDTGYVPAESASNPFRNVGIPMTYDIKVQDGVAYAADASTGLYVLTLNS